MRIVLDASAALHVVLRTEKAPDLIALLEQAHTVLAPSLFHSEVANTLWKYVRAGELGQDAALDRYEEALALVDAFESDDQLAVEAFSAAVRHGHPVYDLLYVVLALRHGCRVLTLDQRLGKLLRQVDEGLIQR